jgi:hypothetical protein
MPPSVLPDFQPFRKKLLIFCSAVLLVLWLVVVSMLDDNVFLWILFGIPFLAAVFMMQSLTLSGDGAPHLPLRSSTTFALAIGIAVLDMMVIYAWIFMLGAIANRTGWFPVFWQGYEPWVAGAVSTFLAGYHLARFEFLRLLLVGHLFAFVLMMLPILVSITGYWRLSYERFAFELRFFELWGGAGCILLLIWGIAPATYLWFFRGYRRRMQIDDVRSEDEMDLLI